ncbi:hypothetical protein ACQKPX_01660 [Photobacterium sp. DNB23_23_1]|uniref:DNA mismatch repair protein n=1 Tax=Photobacterium pectinilyticum TaxID=2906793 RepID=A0ABT1N2G6_9GAMM|nr:hypothetical protein [Photobacterium sp. ZSDE20]MCQ1058064.1 hypothetical protein [Photobacterium sp. ZSDE20]MDD1822597.1 hypothetical protein [Photobacterium sp. ZSDE20]
MKQASSKKWHVPTWTLVAIGLILNIVSALLTNFYIDDLARLSNDIVQRQQGNEKLIQLIWQQVETVERKREHVLVILNAAEMMQSSLPGEVAAQIEHDIGYWLPDIPVELSIESIPTLMEALNEVQTGQREKINDLYLVNQELINDNAGKMKAISRLRNLALFLQVLGLALVLARDLNRKDYR